MLHSFWKLSFGVAAMKYHYRVPRFRQLAHYIPADKASAANYQNTHVWRITLSIHAVLLPLSLVLVVGCASPSPPRKPSPYLYTTNAPLLALGAPRKDQQ